MELHFISPKTCNPSPISHSLLFPGYRKPITSIKLPNKRTTSSTSLSPFFLAKFSFFPALNAIETKRNSPIYLHETNNEKIPAKFSSHNGPKFDTKERRKRYSVMLRECALRGTLNEGKAIHGNVIKNGLDPDSHLWVSLINFYTKSGSQVLARKVLDKMPERDVVSWTALIAGFVSEGYGSDGVGLYCTMRKDNVRPNEFALATVLKACSLCFDAELGKQVHAEAIKEGFLLDLFVGSALVDVYAKCGEMELADRVFFVMPEKNDVSWNALINGYAQWGNGNEVLEVFSRMMKCEVKFSEFNLSTVLKGCSSMGNLRQGKVVHSLAIKSGHEVDEFLGCNLVDMYSKCGMAHDGLKVFKRIKDPDLVAWSAMIAGLAQQGHGREAVKLFHLMRHAGVSPNEFSLASLISAATNLGDLHFGESMHACICKCGFQSDNSVSNALIMMYMKSGCVQDGMRVFEIMTDPDLVSWNALLSGFYDCETCHQGPRIYYQMLVEGFKPNMYTFVSVLRSCSGLLDVGFGKQVHAHIIKNSMDGNNFVGTALIDMYAKSRFVEDADIVFNHLVNQDLFTWTVMIAGYAQTDRVEKAIKYLVQMQRDGVKPNEFALASCLSGCSRMATLENGQQLHSVAIKTGHFGDAFVSSALVDMYGKCGCVEDAEGIFKGLVSRDAVSWNTIISGYSQNGQGEKALEAFRMMLDDDVVPDEITFIGILSACSYMGLVKEGQRLFDSMNIVYGISPSVEHYACMVDILGRAGKFSEAEAFIEEMKLNPYSLIWETVLGACKLHGNIELGERAAKKLFELEPNLESSYILLSNIFAAKGRWDDVQNIRVLMSTKGVKKEPGCSWVEFGGRVHVFVSQDCLHPKTREIHVKLEELREKLTLIGYTPKMENVLHDVTDGEKMEHLYNHSERLALAFSLISVNPVKTIRIFKNLRICEDCHDFMKLTSGITNREIVVRDIKRFHHFNRGTCSCLDCW